MMNWICNVTRGWLDAARQNNRWQDYAYYMHDKVIGPPRGSTEDVVRTLQSWGYWGVYYAPEHVAKNALLSLGGK